MKKPYVLTIDNSVSGRYEVIYARSAKGAVKKFYRENSSLYIVKSVEELKYIVKKEEEKH